VIDNFAPQPYPLECSVDGETWELVIGWRKEPTGEVRPLTADQGGVQYRVVQNPQNARFVSSTSSPSMSPKTVGRPERAAKRPTSE
jgi:hypothetical protein